MTVQTTFVGGVNPWQQYFKDEKPVHHNKGSELTINKSKLVVIDCEGKPIPLGFIKRSRDFFDKMEPGFTLKFDPADHSKIVYLFRMWRAKQPGSLIASKFVQVGQVGLSQSKAWKKNER